MGPVPRKIAIPRFGELIAPCFEYSATVALFVVAEGRVIEQRDFVLQSRRELDRIRLLRDQEVDTLICGGVQDRFEDLIRAHGIRVVSWVSGSVEELLESFLRGELVDRPRPAGPGVTRDPEDKEHGGTT